jgi:hypothetical protein
MRGELKILLLILSLFLAVSSGLSVTSLQSQTSQKTQQQKNAPPSIASFTSSTVVLDLCPFVPDYYIVKLDAKASDPDGDVLTYSYVVTGGSVIGDGPTVDWDLRKTVGKQKAVVEVTDNHGAKTSSAVEVSVVPKTSGCDFPCTTLEVACPASVIGGETVTFEVRVGGDLPGKLTYLWFDSNGKRIPGQGPELKIKARGARGDVIKATVEVLGLDPACSQRASCESKIEKTP